MICSSKEGGLFKGAFSRGHFDDLWYAVSLRLRNTDNYAYVVDSKLFANIVVCSARSYVSH